MVLRPVLLPVLRPVLRDPTQGGLGGFSPAQLFAAGEQGAWYAPDELTTQFQDSAGTTPVTAVAQPVGKILDKSGRGNYAIQATAASRPMVSARYNVLTGTAQLSAAWVPGAGVTFNAGATTSPDGTSIETITFANGGAGDFLRNTSAIAAGSNKLRFYAKSISGDTSLSADLQNVESTAFTLTSQWQLFTATITPASSRTWLDFQLGGPGTIAIYQPDLRTTADAALNIPAYQRVDTAASYSTSGFPSGTVVDGVDDSDSTATGGGSTTGFFYCASITVGGGAGVARTLWSDAGANTGYIVRLNASNQLELAAGNGAAYTVIATVATLNVLTTYVVTAYHDGANISVQVNKGAVASVAFGAVTAGTAAFTEAKDNGAATGFFGGKMFTRIYRKTVPTAAQIAAVQTYVGAKAGLSL